MSSIRREPRVLIATHGLSQAVCHACATHGRGSRASGPAWPAASGCLPAGAPRGHTLSLVFHGTAPKPSRNADVRQPGSEPFLLADSHVYAWSSGPNLLHHPLRPRFRSSELSRIKRTPRCRLTPTEVRGRHPARPAGHDGTWPGQTHKCGCARLSLTDAGLIARDPANHEDGPLSLCCSPLSGPR